MACLFCDSLYHLTQNCDTFPSDESRKQYFVKNKLCEKCLAPSKFNKQEMELCDRCDPPESLTTMCSFCFSKKHNAIFCPFKDEFQLIPPKIDQDLHSRFFQTLDSFEKYSLAFSSPKFLNTLKPKSFAAQAFITESDIGKYLDSDFLAGFWLSLKPNVVLSTELKNALASKVFSIRSKHIDITNIQNFSAEFLLHLLSYQTKSLKLESVTFDSAFTLSKILSKIPNIVEFEFINTKIEIENPLLEESTKYDALCEMNEAGTSESSSQANFRHSEIMINSRNITLRDTQNFSSKFFLRLLSPSTLTLFIRNATFDSPIKLVEILSKIPNIQEIELANTNICIENSWPEDLINCKKEKDFYKLFLKLDNSDFDKAKLTKFMMTKMSAYSSATLEIKDVDLSNSFLTSTFPFSMYSDMLIIRATNVNLCNVTNFPSRLLLRFLSSATKKLICKNSTFDSPIKFYDTLSKIPSIEEIEFNVADVEFEHSWVDGLLLLKNYKNLEKVSLKLDNFNFDFRKLAKFMKLTMKNRCSVNLNIIQAGNNPQTSQILEIRAFKYFVPFDNKKTNQPILSITHVVNDLNSPIVSTFLFSPA